MKYKLQNKSFLFYLTTIAILVGVALQFTTHEITITNEQTGIVKTANQYAYPIMRITAYTLSPDETDSTPCETALGKAVNICELAKKIQLCASNLHPMLTILSVGDKLECVVADRVPKHWNTIDLVFDTKESARQFGVANLPVEVVGKYTREEILRLLK